MHLIRLFHFTKRSIITLIAACAVSSPLGATVTYPENLATFGEVPAWVLPIGLPPVTPDATLHHAGSEFLLVDSQIHPASATYYSRRAIRFINIQGVEDHSTITWTVDPDYETLVLHDLYLIRNGERIDLRDQISFRYTSSAQDDDRNSYDNQVEIRILVPDARAGDILDYATTIRGSNPVNADQDSNSFQQSWTVPVARQHYRILQPETAPDIRWQTHNNADEPVVMPTSGHTEYVWSRTNTPIDRWEDDMPSDVYIQDWVEWSTWPSWEEVSRWGAELYPLDTTTPPELLPLLAEWRKIPALEDRIVAAIRHVQDEYRYVSMVFGPHGYQPFPPSEIVRHRYGDCKDKSLLLCILLRDLGVPAVPVLVDIDDRETVAQRLPSPGVFDHVIVRLWVDGRAYDIDPTVTLQGGTLRTIATTRYTSGLPLAPEGAPLVNDIGIRYDPGTTHMTETFRFDDWAGGADLDVETVYTGEEADSMRRYLARKSIANIGETYREYYAATYGNITLRHPISFTDDRNVNRLVVTEKYKISDLFEPDDNIEDYQETRYFESDLVKNEIPNPTRGITRQHPFRLQPQHIRQTIIIHIPDASDFEPEQTRIDNPHASLAYTVSQDARILRIDADYRVRRTRIHPNDYEKTLADFDRMRDLLSYGIIADVDSAPPTDSDRINPSADPGVSPQPSSSDPAPHIHWVGITLAVVFLIAVHLGFRPLCLAPIPRNFPKPDPTGPSGIGGWLLLLIFGFSAGLVSGSLQIGEFRVFFDASQWYPLTDPNSSQFIEYFDQLILFELLGNLFFLYLTVLFLIALVKKRWFVPRLGIIVLLGNAAFTTLDTMFYLGLDLDDPGEAEAHTAQSVRLWITATIWSLYLRQSRRVRNTFRTASVT